MNVLTNFQAKFNALHFALCYRRVCLCVTVCVCVSMCLCVCVYATFLDARKTVSDRDVVFLELRGMKPYITCKRLTQIGLQIPRWRTKWWS